VSGVDEPKLWLVKIHDDDFRWSRFAAAVVWADTPDTAEQIVRARFGDDLPHGTDTRLTVSPAPDSGIVDYRYASA
jgi:hypothetical protein